ncbi:sulfotransferase domain-containing protein [Thiotrichales bacterium HSG1]|nr:sulfotransferase domain-containing protein [Thiotrichales bacterium HSG1]
MKEDDFQKIDKKGMAEWRDKYRNSSYIFKSFFSKKQDVSDMFKKYLHNTHLFYHAVQKSSGCKYITDSTCSAAYCHNLSLVPEIDLYVIHLIRDAKGVAHSRSMTKYWPNSKVVWLPRVAPWRAAITWVKRNLFIELAFAKKKDRYLRVHYEDLIENPTQTVKRIGKLLGLELKQLDFIDGKNVVLGDTHLTGGNIYVSAKTGKTALKLDERWKSDMKWWNVVLVSLITWPLTLRYSIIDKIKKDS